MQVQHRPVDFHQLAKPANLSNSAVLRMLEEEEARGRGQGLQEKIQKDIKELGKKPAKEPPEWPPTSSLPRPVPRPGWTLPPDIPPTEPGLKRVAWPPPPSEEAEYVVEEPAPVYGQAPGVQPPPAQPTYRPTASPPVPFNPPPTTITLRASPPISQVSQPVYQSQPITATVRGGVRSRGDQKWPPENVKQQSEAENEARIALAKGPAFRPRKVKKDYSQFFAQHALNSTYPGYRPPPGTQHYLEDGTSAL